MGRRIIKIGREVLPDLLGEGFHCFSVDRNPIPPGTRIIDAKMDHFGTSCLILLLENPHWESAEGEPIAEIEPVLTEHHRRLTPLV